MLHSPPEKGETMQGHNVSCTGTQHIYSKVHFIYHANGTPATTVPTCISSYISSDIDDCQNPSNDDEACEIAEPCTPPCNTERTTRTSETDNINKQLMANFILQSLQADTLNNDSLLVKVLLEDNTKDAKKLLIPIYIFADSLVKARHYLDDSLALTNYEDSLYYDFYNVLLTLAEDTLELEDMDAGQLTLMDSIANADVFVHVNAQAVLELIKGSKYDHDPETIDLERLAFQETETIITSGSAFLDNRPNPFSETTQILFNAAEKDKITIIRIDNLVGQTVLMEKIRPGENHLTIQKDQLQKGIYIYSLWIDGVKVKSNKMILID